MSERTFTIEEVDIRTSSKGPFRRIRATPGGWMSVFDSSLFEFVDSHVGRIVTAEVVEKGDFLNIAGIREARNGDNMATIREAGAEPERMTKREWSDKDDRQRLGIMLAVHIERLLQWYELKPDTNPFESYGHLRHHARKLAAEDLEWIKSYEPSKEVPFS